MACKHGRESPEWCPKCLADDTYRAASVTDPTPDYIQFKDPCQHGWERSECVHCSPPRYGTYNGFYPAPPPDDGYEQLAYFERQVFDELEKLRVRREARRRLDAEARANTEPPEILTLRDRLARPKVPTRWRIEGWQPAGSRVVLAAQYKSGKTTLVGNLIRCLVDGRAFLNRSEVAQIEGAVVLLDFEMGGDQLDEWLRDQGITNDHQIVVIPMRGSASSFDIIDEQVLKRWADTLKSHQAAYVVLDCLRPVLDALGLDEHKDAGRFLVAFDELLKAAGVDDAIVVHHMGHNSERSRGDSRIRDWPDVEWRLVREDEEPHSPRYVSAYGRDVDQPESLLHFNSGTRHLSIAGGNRNQAKAQAALADVIKTLEESEPEELSSNAIEMALYASDHSRKAIRDALQLGVRLGSIKVEPGPKNARLHSLNKLSSPVRRSSPQFAGRAESLFAAAPIGRRTETADGEEVSSPNGEQPTCIECGYAVDSVGHQTNCEGVS